MGPAMKKKGSIAFMNFCPVTRVIGSTQAGSSTRKTFASMYHTGGTTGTPKLAPHTHL